MSRACASLTLYADNELDGAARERFGRHLVRCPACQHRLHAILQLRALEPQVWPEQRPVVGRPLRRRWVATAAIAMVAVAAVVLLWPRPDAGDAFARALSPVRSLEARLSWRAADHHRPYDVLRAGEPAVERLSFDLLARVEAERDVRAQLAAHLLIGNRVAAHRVLEAATGADADSDRAAVLLAGGDAEAALLAAAAALRANPAHPQARWNRALALERLGLEESAADGFSAIAGAGEPGWAAEAAVRAQALRERIRRRTAAWDAANRAGLDLLAGALPTPAPAQAPAPTPAPAPAAIDAFPGLMRLYFYDAVRSAPSASRVLALRSLAQALDRGAVHRPLERYLERIAGADFATRGPLAARYLAIARGGRPRTEAMSLASDARRAGAGDIVLGVLLHAGPSPGQLAAADLDEYVQLAEATNDPWFALLAAEQRAVVALARRDPSVAESVLRAAAQTCRANALPYRCLKIELLLVYVYVLFHRPGPAQEVLAAARRSAVETGNVALQRDLLWHAHLVTHIRDDAAALLPLSEAYLEEWRRHARSCAQVGLAAETIAMALVNQNRIDDAREQLRANERVQACDAPPTLSRVFARSHLIRPGDVAARAALEAEIATLRATPELGAGERAFLDHVEGRALIDANPSVARAALRRAIAGPAAERADDIHAVKARSYSYSVLVQHAAAGARWDEALGLLAEERGGAAPARCALGAAGEDAAVFVARAGSGHTLGARVTLRPGQTAASVPVPRALVDALAGCDVVDVFARQPYHGRPDLLPPAMAWQFRVGADRPARPDPSAPSVIVANLSPLASLALPALAPINGRDGAVMIEGAAATPERALAAFAGAGTIEIHAHGLSGAGDFDQADRRDGASVRSIGGAGLVLAPDDRGRYLLTAEEVRRVRLAAAPIVLLAACHAAAVGPAFHAPWGLGDAFVAAGASAVFASPDPIPDASAAGVFEALRARVAGGTAPAAALRDERIARSGTGERAWVERIVLFR